MNRTDSPKKQPVPFAVNGQREDLLATMPAGDNTASYNLGFPPVTMILKSAGGLPPKGQDMNQILYELSALCRWNSAGALNTYDADFSSAIGGYPAGALLISDDGNTIFINTKDGNETNPNGSGTNWKNIQEYLDLTVDGIGAIPLAGSDKITGILRSSTEFQSTCPDSFRIAYNGVGAFWRNDSKNLYLMLTNPGDAFGNYNDLRPFRVNLENGGVAIGTPLFVDSTLTASKNVTAGYVGSYAFSAQFQTGAAFYESFSAGTNDEFHPLLKHKATIPNKAAWSFSFGSLCSNGVISWCLHAIDGGGNMFRHVWGVSGDYSAPGQIIPANYGNFDARYQAKNAANRASRGWYKDTSTGLISQWGVAQRSADTTKVTFPVAFPNACLNIQTSLVWSGGFHDQNTYVQIVDRTAFNYIAGGGEPTSYFFAVGY